MLPKVANHLIQHTSRAVAAVQNQTGHTIRNVLHLQSSTPTTVGGRNGPGSSSSGKGSNGAGAGGAKRGGSSRFYNSYSALSRSVAQADPSALNSVTVETIDEGEEPSSSLSLVPVRRVRQRARSSSLSLSSHDRDAKAERVGLLQALQQHVRARHAFATATADSGLESVSFESPQVEASSESATAADTSEEAEHTEPKETLVEGQIRPDEHQDLIDALKAASTSGDAARVTKLVSSITYPSSDASFSVDVYNHALFAMLKTRRENDSIREILRLYNVMASRMVVPNKSTYSTLITALTDRDMETHKTISFIEARARKLTLFGQYTDENRAADESDILRLRQENNLSTALVLFQAVRVLDGGLSYPVYQSLLRSCALRGNVEAALHVWNHCKRRAAMYTPVMYKYLISCYANAGDYSGAKETFEMFRRAAANNQLSLQEHEVPEVTGVPTWRLHIVSVWSELLKTHFKFGQSDAAFAMLEEMLSPAASPEFAPAGIPTPAPTILRQMISGMILLGDIDSAFKWFKKLLDNTDSPGHPYVPTPRLTKPNRQTWQQMIEILALEGRIRDLDHVVSVAQEQGDYTFNIMDRSVVLHSLLRGLSALPDNANDTVLPALDRLWDTHVRELEKEVDEKHLWWRFSADAVSIYNSFARLYLRHGALDRAVDCIESFVDAFAKDCQRSASQGHITRERRFERTRSIRNLLLNFTRQLCISHQVPLRVAMRVATISARHGTTLREPAASHYLAAYLRASEAEKDALSWKEWSLLLEAWTQLKPPSIETPTDATSLFPPALIDLAAVDVFAMFSDMSKRNIDPNAFDPKLRANTLQLIARDHSQEDLSTRWEKLGPTFERFGANTLSDVASATPTKDLPTAPKPPALSSKIQPDHHLNQTIESVTGKNPDWLAAYELFETGAREGRYPFLPTLGRLINGLGRLGEVEKVQKLYQAAQLVLGTLDNDKRRQSRAWFLIENHMVVALAHAKRVDAAHVHRIRILEQGGCPSADAYGALIESISSTTNDTEAALSLWEEAMSQGVVANIYLYNTIISKLAKARKADHALELFQKMKDCGIRPTSVTYGALIAACCRVGDAISAENLFEEMISQPNFKPRIPPYNTMLQFYTETKPNRERALYYCGALERTGILPTPHTYKLLLELHGTVEPVDLDAMEEVFNKLVTRRPAQVQGTHWAALINVYGCARKDVDKAKALFDSIATHPSTQKASRRLPDEVAFEALMNVFAACRRPDLMDEYVAKMSGLGIRMTAYIANFLIKGYALAGELDKARAIFDSLLDPPEGVAAPGNHAPHGDAESEAAAPPSPQPQCVYREPSTWEAMIRAELGHGNRDRATDLIVRLQGRRFPEAVMKRITGIMLDDFVSPWPSTPSSSPSDSQ